MTDSTIRAYQNRIINSNREQLLIITYELFISELDKSITAIEDNDEDGFNKYMVKVHKFHRELTDNLDMSYEVSRSLLSLYIYMNKKLIESSIRFEKESLIEVKKIAGILLDGFRTAAAGQSSDSLVKNAQKLYAGLTYGKGKLNETVINGVKSRGFKA